MGLPDLAVRRPVATVMLMLIIVVVGTVSLTRLNLDLLPSINPPVAAVLTSYPGASTREVADLVTEPLEESLETTAGIETLRSTSQQGLSLIVVQLTWGSDLAELRQDLRERIDGVTLPDGADEPALLKFDPSQLPVAQIGVTGDAHPAALQDRVADRIAPRLERVAGVAGVQLFGGAERQVQVRLRQEDLNRYGIGPERVAAVLRASDLNFPAGVVPARERELSLRVANRLPSLQALRDLVVAYVPDPDAQAARTPVRLADVADVVEAAADRTSLSRTDGEPGILLSVQREGDANTDRVSDALARELASLREDHPDLEFVTVTDQGAFIDRTIRSVSANLVIGAVLAVMVLMGFLRSLRSTLAIALSIPFAVVATFILIYLSDMTINIMTLGGLALGIGMLVDNSIVVLESIHRHVEDGRRPREAALVGTREVAGAITASTLTTVAVFLPVIFVGGLVGEFFRELSLTVTFALLSSLLISLTVLPMIASRIHRRRAGAARGGARRGGRRGRRRGGAHARGTYADLLDGALRHPWATLLLAVAVLAASVALVPRIGSEFVPVTDEGIFTVDLRMPEGTSLEATRDVVADLEEIVAGFDEVASVSTTVGGGRGLTRVRNASAGEGPNIAQAVVTLVDSDRRERDTGTVMRRARRRTAGVVPAGAELTFNLQSSLMMLGGDLASTLEVYVAGPDRAALERVLPRVRTALADVDGLVSLEDNLEAARPELHVSVDSRRAMEHGLTPGAVATALRTAVQGEPATRLRALDDAPEVVVRYRRQDRVDAAAIRGLVLRGARGEAVRLDEIAEVRGGFGPVSVTRKDGRPTVQIVGLVEGRDLGSVAADAASAVADLDLRPAFEVSLGGGAQLMSEGFGNLRTALLLATALIYMIMAAQFESLLHPLAIMLAMPLTVVGVVVALYLTGLAFGITAYIGVIVLAGIVVNNAIVLVDYTNRLRASGLAVREAVLTAGRRRLRPVLMTALTTMLGMVPLALAYGEGTEVQQPMAVAVLGGLATSTLLTLVVVPVAYYLLEPLGR